ncbi:TonB-linked SusC/RagA family outer membrane protein [Chryseobacterium ginsenosidimutans]|uniref:SusC/RagA family TonB-linked outer membrane protein n=1 Tax=Chryseobacterium ginsenosidimutans TaxID=687846 RepID=UPI002168B7AD|nr:SusC/RagA family TonB-linked outer membrane protein [Chryseobacterium ginsenosidimutans]MCS3869467.1 TonB-linked SusC/RagA family outer membrane protein [Chryseobacterium ginsenosidimutans]
MKNSYYHIGGIFFGLMLTAVSSNTQAQTRTISGTVTSSGKPLSGVNISEEGSDQVTTTSENGTYRLEVTAENPILLFRHPDYAEEKVSATNQTVVNISLEQQVKGIEEVILNAGYYKVKDKERTGSIAKVSAKDIENQPVTNVLSALQGRMAGVNITSTSGNNSGGFDIQIRGRNSLRNVTNSLINGNEPLYVIDGIPVGGQLATGYTVGFEPMRNINPLNAINPNDIESIEVLKDADATAIYGSRGGNGVILVTTKKGSAKEVKFSLNTSYSLSRVANRLEMMSTEQYLQMRQQAFVNDGIATLPATAYDMNGRWDRFRYTDWQKTLIGTTSENSQTQMSISGGGNRSSFLISASHQEQGTVYPGSSGYKTNALNSNYSYNSTDRRFSLTASNYLTLQSNNVMNSDFTRLALSLAPNAPALYDAEGNINWQENTFSNPLAALNGTYEAKTLRLNQDISAGYALLDNVKLKLNGGFNYWSLQETTLSPNTMFNPAFPAGASPASSTSAVNNSNFISYLLEPQLTWSRNISKSKVEVLAGASYQETISKSLAVRGTGYSSNALLHNMAAASVINIEGLNESEYRYAAVFGRINWNYDKKYILNITGRRDGSSRFGPNKRFANFGALGAAWIISEERFLKNKSWLSFAKLRASYGITGSDRIGDYQYLNTYSVTTSPYNSVSGFAPSKLFNPDFSWEKTKKLETAFEASLLKNRINLTASWYRNRSSNQLVGVQLPLITGFSSVQANLDATVENSGWELELNAQIIRSSHWQWSSGFNISFPKNKLISFPGLEGSPYATTYAIGQPTTILKLLEYQGIDPATGQYRFKDANNDGKISILDDAQTVENIGVKFFGGWQHEIKYRNLSFSFLLQFVKQRQTNYYRDMSVPGTLSNQPAVFTNVWSADNPNGIIMPYSSGSNPAAATLTTYLKYSTAAVSDASFIRLKNIQLNYSIPLQGKLLSEAKIFLQGQNLLTWTSYFGIDPEFLLTGYTPPLKTYSIGVQITF